MSHSEAPRLAIVAVARPVRGEFTYLIPPELDGKLLVGQRLRVPFGASSALAFYLGETREAPPGARLRPILATLEETPSLTAEVVELVRFAANHYRSPLGEALKAALPPGLTKAEVKAPAKRPTITWVQLGASALEVPEHHHAQRAVLGYLEAVGGRVLIDEVAHAIPNAKDTIKRLLKLGAVQLTTEELDAVTPESLSASRPQALTPAQAVAVEALTQALNRGGFLPYLLHGVTGSGKTEVYLRVVEHALALQKGALVLVPEIALTPQLVGRFRARFGPRVAVLHSALKERERQVHWQALHAREVFVAVGVRSAIFAPVPNLSAVIVDEEHDPSFKQDEKLRYHARDLAVVRAKQAGCLVVLGSATPSLETLENTRKGRYQLLEMPQRVDDRPMPKISLVDLRQERPRTPETRGSEQPLLSVPLKQALGETLERGQQAILFLNRRGHSTFVVCEVCGQSLKCQNCDVCLTHHLSSNRLQCHYCGYAQAMPSACPECTGPLLQLGLGTERIEAEVAHDFPRARVARLDRDAASTNDKLTDLLASFARRDIDVLVGTQMVAKGHDFPGVTLVCVMLADSALALPDFRAAERTFHLLTQVAGRAGRGKDPGRVLVQTYNPDSPAIAAVLNNDFVGFTTLEMQRRSLMAWPPTTRLVALRLEGLDAGEVRETARRLAKAMAAKLPPSAHGVRLLGPAPAPLSRLKGLTRWQLMAKGPSHAALRGPLAAAEAFIDEHAGNVRIVIDVDPVALL